MIRAVVAIAVLAGAAAESQAEIYELPPDGYDVIGAVATITARHEDTLVDIARRYGLGYQDIVRANPDLDPWLPGAGTEVVLPTRFVLPSGERRGIVLNLAEYRMYFYPEPKPDGTAYVMTYPISIGRMDWETPLGATQVISKVRNPAWYPPKSVREEHAAEGRPLPSVVPPGPDNPLGKFAMRLGLPGYLIHGTNRPAGVGMRVTHGCIRMFPEDIDFVFDKIDVKTPVRIVNEPVKIGWQGDELVMEVHPLLEEATPTQDEPTPTADEPAPGLDDMMVVAAGVESSETVEAAETNEDGEETMEFLPSPKDPLTYVTERFIAATADQPGQLDWQSVEAMIERSDGIPAAVGEGIKNAATSAASQ